MLDSSSRNNCSTVSTIPSLVFNVMLPVIAYNLLQSIELLSTASRTLADSTLAGFKVNEARIGEALNRNPILVTALNPVIGYEAGAKIAKEAYATGRPIKDVAAEKTQLSPEELAKYLDPRELTKAGGKAEGGGG